MGLILQCVHIFVSDKRRHLLVEVARAEMMRPPRARNFDQKVPSFIRDKDMATLICNLLIVFVKYACARAVPGERTPESYM